MNCISFISFPNWDSTVSCKRWVFNKYLSPEKHSIWQMCRRRMLPFYYKLFFLEIEYKLMIMSLNDAKLYRKKSSPPSFLFIILSPPLPTTSKYITNFFYPSRNNLHIHKHICLWRDFLFCTNGSTLFCKVSFLICLKHSSISAELNQPHSSSRLHGSPSYRWIIFYLISALLMVRSWIFPRMWQYIHIHTSLPTYTSLSVGKQT